MLKQPSIHIVISLYKIGLGFILHGDYGLGSIYVYVLITVMEFTVYLLSLSFCPLRLL